MNGERIVIFVPGLSGKVEGIQAVTSNWAGRYDLTPVMWPMVWKDNEPFQTKISRLLEEIDTYDKPVSMVGASAGGAMVVNALGQKPERILKVVTACSRLRVGSKTGFRGFEERTKQSIAFAEAVKSLSTNPLPQELLPRVMNIRAGGFDELVPPDTAFLEGAQHYTVPWGEHVMSIGLALSVFSYQIIKFLSE